MRAADFQAGWDVIGLSLRPGAGPARHGRRLAAAVGGRIGYPRMTQTATSAPSRNPLTRLRTYAHDLCFKGMHGNRLIYNACWEDPRLDRQMLRLNQKSRLLMITSAGCNALDYLLDNPEAIHTVDLNFRQNSVLALKANEAVIKGRKIELTKDLFTI